jgi:hypothetical protein
MGQIAGSVVSEIFQGRQIWQTNEADDIKWKSDEQRLSKT